MTISAALREYAESPDRFAHVPAGASVERIADDRVCILQGPTWASVSGVTVGEDEVPALLAEVRDRVPAEKEPVWWMGPSTRPSDLDARLRKLGLREPRDQASLLKAVVLTQAPDAGAHGVDVRRIETYEQFRAAREVQWEAFETHADKRERERARLREEFAEARRFGVPVGFLGLLDGRPAATALAVPSERGLFLIGGCTARWARGRGLYRALVRARWEHAVARGTPALVTQAVPETSYPILRRLGFRDVCTIRRVQEAARLVADSS